MAKSTYNVISVMSGTSLDGIDIIYTTFSFRDEWSFQIKNAETIKYSHDWKTTLANLINKTKKELEQIDIEYSKHLANVINIFIEKHNVESIDFISSHGHTALHQPGRGLTYQIGNLQPMADLLRLKVICDFRVQDVLYGGQGAPLVPIGDRLLFSNYEYCLNLGGFANISFESDEERIAYDICPVNIVLNHYISSLGLDYDDKGSLASSGKVNYKLLDQLNRFSYYSEEPPKSLGLEWVQQKIIPLIDSPSLSIEDILNTFIEHVAMQIAKNLKRTNAEVLITGGGVYNDFLIKRLKKYSKAKIVIPKKEIIEFKEALIFGLLGVLKEREEVNCLKSVTGANKDHSSGVILLPNL